MVELHMYVKFDEDNYIYLVNIKFIVKNLSHIVTVASV